MQAVALHDFEAEDEAEDRHLPFAAGDRIVVTSTEDPGEGWSSGELNGKVGVFPSNHVQLLQTDSTPPPSAPPADSAALPTVPATAPPAVPATAPPAVPSTVPPAVPMTAPVASAAVVAASAPQVEPGREPEPALLEQATARPPKITVVEYNTDAVAGPMKTGSDLAAVPPSPKL